MFLAVLGFIAFVLFILFDLVWFHFAGDFFKGELGSIARVDSNGGWDVRLTPAALVYLLMSVGIIVFAYLNSTSLLMAVLLGGLFGLIGYGLYDLTNLATLSNWTTKFVIVDMLWGTFLCGSVSGLVYLAAKIWF